MQNVARFNKELFGFKFLLIEELGKTTHDLTYLIFKILIEIKLIR